MQNWVHRSTKSAEDPFHRGAAVVQGRAYTRKVLMRQHQSRQIHTTVIVPPNVFGRVLERSECWVEMIRKRRCGIVIGSLPGKFFGRLSSPSYREMRWRPGRVPSKTRPSGRATWFISAKLRFPGKPSRQFERPRFRIHKAPKDSLRMMFSPLE